MAANLRQLKWLRKYRSAASMAADVGISRGAMNRYLKGERTMGLDVLLLVHRNLGASMDWICDRDPDDKRWMDPAYKSPGEK
jgi:transcriptional regulator with XRE-family HTH domain